MKYFSSIKLISILTVLGVFIAIPVTVNAKAYRFNVSAIQQSKPSIISAEVDIAALTGKKNLTISKADVRMQESIHTRSLASRIDKVDGQYKVTWRIPGAKSKKDAGKKKGFVVTLIHGKQSKAQPLKDVKTNLIYNGDFESKLKDKLNTKNFRIKNEDGNHVLTFNKDNSLKTHSPTYYSQKVYVKPGYSYVVSFRYKVVDGKVHPHSNLTIAGSLYFRDKNGKNIPPRIRAVHLKSNDSNGWQTYKKIISMPSGTDYAFLRFSNWSLKPWSVLIDDLRIAPVNPIKVTSVKTSDGDNLDLRLQSPDIRRFDLGTKDSSIWSGYTALTPEDKYSSKKGYGFSSLHRPFAKDHLRPNALTKDFISSREARLRVDLPDGKYQVYLISGDSQVGSTLYWLYFNSIIKANGKKVWKDKITPIEFFKHKFLKHYYDFWTPNMSYYKTFVSPHFTTHHFTTKSNDGHIKIGWSNLPVNAIIIAPDSHSKKIAKEMEYLKKQRQRATKIIAVDTPKDPAPTLNSADKKRGFVLFHRPANIKVYPTSKPKKNERINSLKTFATPGQTQSVHFSLYPIVDLGDTSIKTTLLKDSSGNSIPASAIDIRVSRYIFRGIRSKPISSAYKYQVDSFPLDYHKLIPLTKETTWSWWATIHVPKDTKPGIYKGSLIITPAKGTQYKLPLHLRVLPFALKPLNIAQGYYYYGPRVLWYSTFWHSNLFGTRLQNNKKILKLIKEKLKQNFTFMHNLGLTSVAFGDDLRHGITLDKKGIHLKEKNRFSLFMNQYTKSELNGPMLFFGFSAWGLKNRMGSWWPKKFKKQFTKRWNDAYKSFVINTNELAKRHNWNDIYWSVTSEASNRGTKGAQIELKAAKALKGTNATTYSAMNGPYEQIIPGHIDIAMPNFAYPITKKTIKNINNKGSKLFIYNCGMQRVALGLYPWRIGAKGRFQWQYREMSGDPWDDVDGRSPESYYSISLPGPNGPVATLRSEAIRAAITDHRYINTLEAAIKSAQNNKSKSKVAKMAEEFLIDLKKQIPINRNILTKNYLTGREAGIENIHNKLINADNLNRIRWAVAQYIMKLKN